MLKKILIILFTILYFNSINTAVSVPAKNGKLVRVGISDSKLSNYYFSTISVSATDKFKLLDKSTNTLIADFGANEIVKIDIQNNLLDVSSANTQISNGLKGPVIVESEDGFVTIANLKRAGKPALYRGTLEITKCPQKNNQFNVINVLDVESYLRGVVPNEMPVKFGLEALKVQSIAARNYVLRPRTNNYHNFDVCDSVACQVYYGANTEKELSDKAIVETENLVAMYNGELILALYSSTAGGHTENFENAFSTDLSNGTRIFPGEEKPFLKGMPDNPNTPDLSKEEEARKFYTTTPETFDNASRYFRWTKEWELSELESVLRKTLKTQSPVGFVKPKLDNPNDFGKIQDIKVTKRGVSGKAMAVEIATDKGDFIVQKELPIRRTFQKDNISLPSANVVFDIIEENITTSNNSQKTIKKVIAHGGGFGHGVGMSQYGAGEMCRLGYTYDEILQHYYKGVSINSYPLTLSSQTGNESASQIFYTNNKNTSLILENKFQFTKLIIVLNEQELHVELSPNPFRLQKIDLSKYVVNGKNKITYILPYSELNKKPIKLYLEIKEAKNE